MERFTNEQAAELFNGKFIISNSDGTIWTANKAEIYSYHQPEYSVEAKDWQVLECKYPWVRGFGQKKVRFENLQKTPYTREQFANTFGGATLKDPLNLMSKNIEKLK